MQPISGIKNIAHGSPYDRGGADSWYSRDRDPHKWVKHPNPKVKGEMLKVTDLTPQEVVDYHQGYTDNEEAGGKKEW